MLAFVVPGYFVHTFVAAALPFLALPVFFFFFGAVFVAEGIQRRNRTHEAAPLLRAWMLWALAHWLQAFAFVAHVTDSPWLTVAFAVASVAAFVALIVQVWRSA
jgi:hypothetical protein